MFKLLTIVMMTFLPFVGGTAIDSGTCTIEVRGRIFEYPCPPEPYDCKIFDPDTGNFKWIPCP